MMEWWSGGDSCIHTLLSPVVLQLRLQVQWGVHVSGWRSVREEETVQQTDGGKRTLVLLEEVEVTLCSCVLVLVCVCV